MKLGLVSAILHELSLEEVLAFAAAEKFSCVEVMCWPVGKADRRFAGVTHIDVTDFTTASADTVHAACDRHGVGLSALGYYPNLLDPDPAVASVAMDHLKKVMVAARLLGLDTVNTFVGRDWSMSVDDNWPRFLEVWRPLVRFAEDQGVRIGIENCPMFFTGDEWPGGKNLMTTPARWRRAFADIPSANFGLNFDPSHFALQFIQPASALQEFKDRLFHLHAKDVKIHRDRLDQVGIFAPPLEWHQPRVPGFGEIDWAAFMAAVMETGYDGPICIEVEDDTFGNSLAGRQRALRVARDVLHPFIGAAV
jgi:sugar phosphate isomerase/epimerase